MECRECGGKMVKVCDPRARKCYWKCPDCGNEEKSELFEKGSEQFEGGDDK